MKKPYIDSLDKLANLKDMVPLLWADRCIVEDLFKTNLYIAKECRSMVEHIMQYHEIDCDFKVEEELDDTGFLYLRYSSGTNDWASIELLINVLRDYHIPFKIETLNYNEDEVTTIQTYYKNDVICRTTHQKLYSLAYQYLEREYFKEKDKRPLDEVFKELYLNVPTYFFIDMVDILNQDAIEHAKQYYLIKQLKEINDE